MRAIVLIPVYDHDRYIAPLVGAIVAMGHDVLLVDDGSGASCAAVLDAIVRDHPAQVALLRRAQNGGKGAAVLDGLAWAAAHGCTHAVQVDADWQHDIADIPRLLALAAERPEAMVTGRPLFDASVPRHRYWLRHLTHVMVSVNTLVPRLRDAFCGFRVYPVARVLDLVRRSPMGLRMDFDIELFVKLDWDGVPIVELPTRVRYPADGVSHFRLVRDNTRITWMHTRLFVGMLARAPRLLARRLRAPAVVPARDARAGGAAA